MNISFSMIQFSILPQLWFYFIRVGVRVRVMEMMPLLSDISR